jgi:hypothetical protein
MTPNFAVVCVENPHWHTPRLWLPLFLLWIPVVLFSPVIFLVLVALAIVTRTTIWRIMAIFWNLVCALRGTDIRVTADGNHVLVRIL